MGRTWPVRSWVSPETETPQSLGETCPTAWTLSQQKVLVLVISGWFFFYYYYKFKWRFLCFSLCPLPLVHSFEIMEEIHLRILCSHQGHIHEDRISPSLFSPRLHHHNRRDSRRDPDMLENRACENLMMSYKAECKVLHLGWGNLRYVSRLAELTESSPVEKDLGVLVDKKARHEPTAWACLSRLKANSILAMQPSEERWQQGGDCPLVCPREATPAVLHPGRGPQHREGMELFEWVLGRPWRPREGWSTSCEYRLRELGLFSLEKRRLWGDILAAFQCLKGAYKQEVEQLFTQSDSDKTRWNGFILKGEI